MDTTATLASKTISGLETKMDYLMYDIEIHSYFSRINELSLSEALDLVYKMNDAASIISLDNDSVTARWYPVVSTTSYGDYCQTLDVLASEFPAGTSDPVYQRILALRDNQLLWKSRHISRNSPEHSVASDRLCLYSRFSILGHSACLLEISLPVSDFIVPLETPLPSGSLFAISLGQNEGFEYLTLSSADSAQATSLLSEYEQTGHLAEYEIIQRSIANTDHSSVLLLLPKSYVDDLLWPVISDILLVYLLIAVTILCTCYLTSHFLTRKILKAIKEIQQDISTVLEQPTTESTVPTDIQRICVQVKNLVQNAQAYCRKIDYYEKESIRTELELLQMRFNPHLLYNTLAAVNCHAREQSARQAIVSLSNYYRVVLNNGRLIIRVRDEIEMVKEYLSVMKYTYFLDSIAYQFEIDEEVQECTIIKHVLQPIVENAIHHGLRPLKGTGIQCIRGKAEGDVLLIQVIDNGLGMTHEETEKLLTEPTTNFSSSGYGIYNVQSRLQLHYGKSYGQTVESTKGEGTCVTMRIPRVTEQLSDNPQADSLTVP